MLSQRRVKTRLDQGLAGEEVSLHFTSVIKILLYLSEPGPKSSTSCPEKMIWVSVSRSEGRPGPSRHLRGRGDQTQHHLKNKKHTKHFKERLRQTELKAAQTASPPADISPVNTFQILITPFSKPVARSRLLFPFGGVPLAGQAEAADLGGLGPKARPHTGWPQLKLLSPRSVSPFWLSLRARRASSVEVLWK